MSAGLSDWDPITVEILVGTVSQLRDAAMAAWGAAGDTVIIDGVTVSEGVAGRGVYRVFGLAGLLLSMDGGGPNGSRLYRNDMSWAYTYPDNREVSGSLSGIVNNGNYGIGNIGVSETSMSLSATNGGVTDLVTPITVRAIIANGTAYGGSVNFTCGNLTRSVGCWNQDGLIFAECTFNGADLGGNGSYLMSADHPSFIGSNGYFYTRCDSTIVIGVE